MFPTGWFRKFISFVSVACVALTSAAGSVAASAGTLAGAHFGSRPPVHPASGSHTLAITDFAIPGRGAPLRLARAYNHRSERMGLFGRGWTSNLELRRGAAASFANDDEQPLFDSSGRLTGWVDARGLGFRLEYKDGLPVRLVDSSGRVVRFETDRHGRVVAVTDVGGRKFRYGYDERGNLTATKTPLSGRTRFAYDDANRLAKVLDAKGNTVREFAYDDEDRVTGYTAGGRSYVLRYVSDSVTALAEPASGSLWRYRHRDGVVVAETGPDGNMMSRVLADGRVTSTTDRRENTISYERDERGNVTRMSDAHGATNIVHVPGTDLVRSITNALGHETTFEYDDFGSLTKVTAPDGSATLLRYDEYGQRTSVTNALGETWKYTYDEFGNQTSRTSPEGRTQKRAYDELGNVLAVTDPGGGVTRFGYDRLGRLVRTTAASGAVTSYQYDANGNIARVTVPGGGTVERTFDKHGRLTGVALPNGGKRRIAYDRYGNLAEVADGRGAHRYTHDRLGRLVGLTDALNQSVTASLDPHGLPRTVTDALGNSYRETHDSRGLITSMTDPLGRVTRFGYDAMGRIANKKDAQGRETTFEYDVRGHAVGVRYPDGSRVAISRDALARVVRVVGRESDFSYGYTADGYLATARNELTGETVSMEHDAAGRISVVKGPSAPPTRYARDSAGRVVSIHRGDALVTAYTRNSAGLVERQEMGNGTVTAYAYDAVGNPLRMETRDGDGALLFSQRMIRDNTGLVTRIEQASSRVDGGLETTATSYRYDREKRLIAEERRDADGVLLSGLSYAYDANGNRVRMSDHLGRETLYAYDGANQLLRETTGDSTIGYAYDANGNLVSETLGDETVTYRYDFENRLISVRGPSLSVDYVLAPDGKRIASTVNGRTTTYVHSNLNVIEESVGDVRTDYTHGFGVDELLMRSGNGARAYYHRGNVNSVLGLTDPHGKVVASYDYTAFGTPLRAEEAAFNPYRYTSRPLEATGLYHFRERALSTRTGRFLSIDPIRTDAARSIRFGKLPELSPEDASPLFQARLDVHVTGMDLAGYVYAGNNSINAMDPTGEILVWNPLSLSTTSGCAGSGCVASGCGASVCLGSGCGGSGCVGSACTLSLCLISGCAVSVCKGSACIGSGCAGSACAGSACKGSFCLLSACTVSVCGVSGCMGSACALSACVGSACGGSVCVGSYCVGTSCPMSNCVNSDCFGSGCYMSSCDTACPG